MNNTQIPAQYSTGLSQSNIEQALIAAGKNLDQLQPADLALMEDFPPWVASPPANWWI